MHCAQARRLLEAFTLGTLAAAEQTALTQHLQTCAACQARARHLASALHTLPQALSAAAPQALSGETQVRLWQRLETALEAGGAQAEPSPTLPPRWRLAGTVAALLLLGVLLASNLHLRAQERGLRASMALLAEQQEVVLEIVDSAHTTKRLLRPPDGRRGGTSPYGKLYTRADMLHVVAMVARLPQPPAEHVYYLWVGGQDHLQRAGTLTVNAQGFGLLVFDAPQPGPVYDLALVTLQPVGSTQPASPPVLRWEAAP